MSTHGPEVEWIVEAADENQLILQEVHGDAGAWIAGPVVEARE